MNVTIIGASAHSTPCLFQALRQSPALANLRFALCSRDTHAVGNVLRAARVLAGPELQARTFDATPEGLNAAVEGAEFIVIQNRYGGLDGREFDESFPLEYGLAGDEGLGPGGLSAAWRAWPKLSALLAVIQRQNSAATVILLSSPCSLLTRLARMVWPRLSVSAVCELPIQTLIDLGFRPDDEYQYIGINHLGWFYGLPGMPSPVPLKYWRLHTDRAAVIAESMGRQTSRAHTLRAIAERSMMAFADGDPEVIAKALASRPAPWYELAIAPMLESFVLKQSRTHFFLSVPNSGWCPLFDDEDILEIPYQWEYGRFQPRKVSVPPQEHLVNTLKALVAYERDAAMAILERSQHRLIAALSGHPWLKGCEQLAEPIVNRILRSHSHTSVR